MTTPDALHQAENILNAQALHYARVICLNRIKINHGQMPVGIDDVVFHEIPGKPGLLRYEYTSNTPPPVHAAHVVGPKPIPKLTRREKWGLYAGSVLADIIEKVRWSR